MDNNPACPQRSGGRQFEGMDLTPKDPFGLHPELRDKIKPAAQSFFRDLDMDIIDAHTAQAGFPADWRTPCETREAERRKWLDGHWGHDLWVFGYGSLMWDPALEFVEVRHAHCDGFQRSFCLWDEGGRGSDEQPGLMLALDEGGACGGLAFRIAAKNMDHETFVLFRREMIAPAYRPVWLNLVTVDGPIQGLGFAANHGHENIRPGIPLDKQAGMIARARGIFGTNFEYLSDTHRHLKLLGVDDAYISELFARASALNPVSS